MHLNPKRWLFLIHRWLGIFLALLFALWFFSGMVMMYIGYPKLSQAERLAHLPPLASGGQLLPPGQALAQAGISQPLQGLSLSHASGGQPVYLASLPPAASTPRAANITVIDARSGQRLPPADADRALASAAAWLAASQQPSQPPPTWLGLVDEDAHTHSRDLDPHRPLHHVQLHDAAATQLYISSRTGAVVRDAPRLERGWNYVGTWLHWLYMFRGGAWQPWWSWIIDTLASLGIATAVSGAIIGVMRWRFRQPYRTGRRTPYPQPMMRWHHISGMLFAAIAFTWVFSGLMSMNPLGIFTSKAAPPNPLILQGGPLTPAEAGTLAAPDALLAASARPVRELRWVRALGRTLAVAYAADGAITVLDARQASPAALAQADLAAAAQRMLPTAHASAQLLREYDFYYYARAAHTMTGGHGNRPLPVLRITFDDPGATWLHIHPATGELLDTSTRPRRISRWLFTLLHSWDWLPLLERRPLWDAVMLGLSLGGLALSLTGVVIGIRRLALNASGGKKAKAAASPQAPAAAPSATPSAAWRAHCIGLLAGLLLCGWLAAPLAQAQGPGRAQADSGQGLKQPRLAANAPPQGAPNPAPHAPCPECHGCPSGGHAAQALAPAGAPAVV